MAYYDDTNQLEYNIGSAERGALGLTNRDTMLRSTEPSGFGLGNVGTAGHQKYSNTTPSAWDPNAPNMTTPSISSRTYGSPDPVGGYSAPSRTPSGEYYASLEGGSDFLDQQVAANKSNAEMMLERNTIAAETQSARADEIIEDASKYTENQEKILGDLAEIRDYAGMAMPVVSGAFIKDKDKRKRALGQGIGAAASKLASKVLDAAFANLGKTAAETAGSTVAETAVSEGLSAAGKGAISGGLGSVAAGLVGGDNLGKAAAKGAASGVGQELGQAAGTAVAGPVGGFVGRVAGGILPSLFGGGGPADWEKPMGRTAVASGLQEGKDLLGVG